MPLPKKLHEFTRIAGRLPTLKRQICACTAVEFEKTLQDENGMTTGRLGHALLLTESRSARQGRGTRSAIRWRSAPRMYPHTTDYARKELKFGDNTTFHVFGDVNPWNWDHKAPGGQSGFPISTNVMLDLRGASLASTTSAMIYNPNLHILLTGGYYDLATPYFSRGVRDAAPLPVPTKLQANIEYDFYESGHMVYAHDESLKRIHDAVAGFIGKTDNFEIIAFA